MWRFLKTPTSLLLVGVRKRMLKKISMSYIILYIDLDLARTKSEALFTVYSFLKENTKSSNTPGCNKVFPQFGNVAET